MLEHSPLLLMPWTSASTTLGPREAASRGKQIARQILDAQSGETLGFVCHRRSLLSNWFPWLFQPLLEVREIEDTPLLFTIRPPNLVGFRWRVFDAEDRLVGVLRRSGILLMSHKKGPDGNALRSSCIPCVGVIENQLGHIVAYVQRSPEGTGWFHGMDETELGTLGHSPAGTLLAFGASIEEAPFAKMLLLATAICFEGATR